MDSTDISSASEFSVKHNKSNDLLAKDLTLYSKSIAIENKFNKEFLNYNPITNRHITEDYILQETLYDVVVAPTKILIGKHALSENTVAIKQVNKSKLNNLMMFEFIFNEFVVTNYLSTYLDSVVKVIAYYEDDQNLSMVMEYCNRPNFFEELLENVSFNIRLYNYRDIVP